MTPKRMVRWLANSALLAVFGPVSASASSSGSRLHPTTTLTVFPCPLPPFPLFSFCEDGDEEMAAKLEADIAASIEADSSAPAKA